MILVYSKNAKANSREKTFTKSKYSMKNKVRTLFITNAAIYTLQKRLILPCWSLLELSKKAIYIIKISYLKLRAIATNSFFSISLTYLIIKKTSSII